MNLIEMAIKMEQEAVDFYRKCAEKTNNPVGKQMFLSIAEDEQYHIACAAEMKKGQPVIPAQTSPVEDMKRIFEEHKEAMLQRVPSTADELEALRIGMKMEEEAIAFYRNAAPRAASPGERSFFDCLIRDEVEHFRIFQNTSSFLSDSLGLEPGREYQFRYFIDEVRWENDWQADKYVEVLTETVTIRWLLFSLSVSARPRFR